MDTSWWKYRPFHWRS